MLKEIEIENKGTKLSAVLHIPDVYNPPAIVISHGFTADKNKPLLVACADELENKGYVVLRFDYRGHGKSSGLFEKMTIGGKIDDLTTAINFIAKLKHVNSSKIGVLSHSLGTTITILNSHPRIKASVMMAPLPNLKLVFSKLFDKYCEKGWEQDFIRSGFVFMNKGGGYKVNKEFWDQVKVIDVKKEIKNFNSPTLFIGATNDSLVSLDEFRNLYYAANEPKEKIEVPGDHNFNGNEQEVVRHVVGWFDTHLKT